MSISKKTLEEAHIALLDNGQTAIVDSTANGNLRIHRVITREELLNLSLMLYIQYTNDNPDRKVLQIPFGENKVLAMTMIEVEPPDKQEEIEA